MARRDTPGRVRWWTSCAMLQTFENTAMASKNSSHQSYKTTAGYLAHSTEITKAIHEAINITSSQVVFTLEDESTCSMYASGAMVLLLAIFDAGTIWLMGRFHINAIYKHHHRPSKQVWRRAWSNMGTMRPSRPSMRSDTPVPQVWASHIPSLGIGGWNGIGLVWPHHLNTPFTHQ